MASIAARLDELVPLFQDVDSVCHSALRTQGLARDFSIAVNRAAAEALVPKASGLERRMLALAQALTTWASSAAAANPAKPLFGMTTHFPWLAQLTGACTSLAALAIMASKLSVPSSAAFRIAAACHLVFNAGRRAMAAVKADIEAELVFLARPDWTLLLRLTDLAIAQLAAVANVVHLLQHEARSTAGAAFARSTAKPETLLPWLMAALQVLEWTAQLDGLHGFQLDDPTAHLLLLVNSVLTTAQFEEHAAGIAAEKGVQEAICGALLTVCLPHLAPAFAEAVAADLPPSSHQRVVALAQLVDSLAQPALAPAVRRCMRQPFAAKTVRHAATVVAAAAALPANLPASLADRLHLTPADACSKLHLQAARLLALGCSDLPLHEPQQDGLGSCSRVDGAAIDPARAHAVAWEVVAAVPHICSAIRVLLSKTAACDTGNLEAQAAVVDTYRCVRAVMHVELGQSSYSADQLLAWAAAAEASLRVLPLLLQLDATLQQLPGECAVRGAAGGLTTDLLSFLREHWPSSKQFLGSHAPTAEPDAAAALRHQLAQAHLAGCRLVHWLAQRATADKPAGPEDDSRLSRTGWCALLLTILSRLFHVLLPLSKKASRAVHVVGLAVAQAPALAVAHGEAAAALARLAAVTCCGRHPKGLELSLLQDASKLTVACLSVLVPACSGAVGAYWSAALSVLLSCLPEGGLPALSLAELGRLLQAVSREANSQRCSVTLAGSGLLAAVVSSTQRHCMSEEETLDDEALDATQANAALDGADAIVQALVVAADAAVQSSSVPDSLAAQLSEAANSLLHQRQAALGSMPADALPAERAGRLRQLLQPAADLAALMQQYYTLPAVDKPHQLALAQAAAGRSCAYLRCANVEGEGGPAAGQGLGNMRCSACRAVWYCGTTCSHADWRQGGHRRVCKALGEARRAAKKAAAAVAAQQE